VLLLLRALQLSWIVGVICFYFLDALPDAKPSTSSQQGWPNFHLHVFAVIIIIIVFAFVG